MESLVMQNIIRIAYVGKILPIIVLVIFFFIGCAGQVKENEEIPDSKIQNTPPPPTKKLAPGTAKIEAKIVELNEEKNFYRCVIKVERVLGYGMATKPIGKGTEIPLQFSKDESKTVKAFSEGTLDQLFELIVLQEEMVGLASKELRWSIIKINKSVVE
jgi:hypothetical protein